MANEFHGSGMDGPDAVLNRWGGGGEALRAEGRGMQNGKASQPLAQTPHACTAHER
jgi:hypothetical protein